MPLRYGKVPDITLTQWTSLFIASAWELSVSDEYVCADREKLRGQILEE